jgi:hypothetical protein
VFCGNTPITSEHIFKRGFRNKLKLPAGNRGLDRQDGLDQPITKRHTAQRREWKSSAPWYFSAAFSVIVLTYSIGFGRSAPFSDEWAMYPDHVNFSWLMEPLNEHWLPLPKLLYVGTVHAFGGDARSSQALVVVILGAAALLAARELIQRGKWALSWLVPFVVFHPAQYETLLSGINLHSALCAALLITAGVLALRGHAFGPMWCLIIDALSLNGRSDCSTLFLWHWQD